MARRRGGLQLNPKSSIHHARTGVTLSVLRTPGHLSAKDLYGAERNICCTQRAVAEFSWRIRAGAIQPIPNMIGEGSFWQSL